MNNGHKKAHFDRRTGEVPPEENEALEPNTLVIEDEVLRKGFTSAPNYILEDTKLSIAARFTYITLLSFAWQQGSCFPGQTKLASKLGVTDRAVRKYLTELIEAGYLKVARRGLGKTNVYHLLKGRLGDADRNARSDQERNEFSDQERNTRSYNEDSIKRETVQKDLDPSNSRDKPYSSSGKTRTHPKTPSEERESGADENEGEAWSGNIAQIMGDFTKFELHDLEDPANVYRNPKRVMKLWRKSGLSEEDFTPLLYEAKKITLQHSGSIRKNAGESRSTKNRAPYFFGVLNNLIAAKQMKKLEEKRAEALAKTQGGFVKRMSP